MTTAHVSLSHEVNPETREFERTSSTVLNAAAVPVVVDYINCSHCDSTTPERSHPPSVTSGTVPAIQSSAKRNRGYRARWNLTVLRDRATLVDGLIRMNPMRLMERIDFCVPLRVDGAMDTELDARQTPIQTSTWSACTMQAERDTIRAIQLPHSRRGALKWIDRT